MELMAVCFACLWELQGMVLRDVMMYLLSYIESWHGLAVYTCSWHVYTLMKWQHQDASINRVGGYTIVALRDSFFPIGRDLLAIRD